MTFCLSAGQEGDGPQGRRLLKSLGPTPRNVYLAMDRAYEGDETRAVAKKQGFTAVVPPKRDRREPWEYDQEGALQAPQRGGASVSASEGLSASFHPL